jgi:hypothetical protein
MRLKMSAESKPAPFAMLKEAPHSKKACTAALYARGSRGFMHSSDAAGAYGNRPSAGSKHDFQN